jgi:hypothetical protein
MGVSRALRLTQFRTLVVRLAVDSYDLHYALEATCKQFKLVEWFDPRCQSGSRYETYGPRLAFGGCEVGPLRQN